MNRKVGMLENEKFKVRDNHKFSFDCLDLKAERS
jgi:hypothetical protein